MDELFHPPQIIQTNLALSQFLVRDEFYNLTVRDEEGNFIRGFGYGVGVRLNQKTDEFEEVEIY